MDTPIVPMHLNRAQLRRLLVGTEWEPPHTRGHSEMVLLDCGHQRAYGTRVTGGSLALALRR